MKFLLKLLGVLVALVVVVYFGVIIATGFVIENQLAKLNDYLHQDPNNEFLNNIEVAYEKGELDAVVASSYAPHVVHC